MSIPELDLEEIGDVHFEKPDTDTFRGLPLAYRAAAEGGACRLFSTQQMRKQYHCS